MPLRKIREEDDVSFKSYDQLSYADDGFNHVRLYVDDIFIGHIKVWIDRMDNEFDARDYICVNYEMIYLDTIKKYLGV